MSLLGKLNDKCEDTIDSIAEYFPTIFIVFLCVVLLAFCGGIYFAATSEEKECIKEGSPYYVKSGNIMIPITNCEEYAP